MDMNWWIQESSLPIAENIIHRIDFLIDEARQICNNHEASEDALLWWMFSRMLFSYEQGHFKGTILSSF